MYDGGVDFGNLLWTGSVCSLLCSGLLYSTKYVNTIDKNSNNYLGMANSQNMMINSLNRRLITKL